MPHLMRHLLYLEKSYFFLRKIADVLAAKGLATY